MKIYTILLLLIAFVFADCKLTVPIDVDVENVKAVTDEGWALAKPPLKRFFQNDGDKFMRSFLEASEQPITPNKEDPIYSIPNLNMTRTDYYFGLAYAKYLESEGKTEEALNIYRSILEGLNSSFLKTPQLISFIFLNVIERLVTNSLQNNVDKNIYNVNQRKQLRTYLRDNLQFDSHSFLKALETDTEIFQEWCENDLVKDRNFPKEFLKDFNLTIDNELLARKSKHTRLMFKKICIMRTNKQKNFDLHLNQINSATDYEAFAKDHKQQEEAFYKWLKSTKSMSSKELTILKKNLNNYIYAISNILFYIGVNVKLGELKLELLDNIKANKRLMHSLESKPPNKLEESNQKTGRVF